MKRYIQQQTGLQPTRWVPPAGALHPGVSTKRLHMTFDAHLAEGLLEHLDVRSIGGIYFCFWNDLGKLLYPPGNFHISHLGKRKIIFKMPFFGDMLVPWRVFPKPTLKGFWGHFLILPLLDHRIRGDEPAG